MIQAQAQIQVDQGTLRAQEARCRAGHDLLRTGTPVLQYSSNGVPPTRSAGSSRCASLAPFWCLTGSLSPLPVLTV